jgi:hypothetical protein
MPGAELWIALGVVTVVLGLAGYAVTRLNAREVARSRAARRLVPAVPAELRPRPAPGWFQAALAGSMLAAGVAGWAIAPGWGVLLAPAGPLALYPIGRRFRDRDAERVVDEVRRGAGGMSPAQLDDLVHGLELLHGRSRMKPLRDRGSSRHDMGPPPPG